MSQGYIYLASSSPRRRELLEQIRVPYRIYPVDVDERLLGGEAPLDFVTRVAVAKAQWASEALLAEGRPVLAADTAVVLHGEVLGKPRDRDEALEMLARLSGRTHLVMTAVALSAGGVLAQEVSVSQVSFRETIPQERNAYWDTGEPADKAGAYAIQGLGAAFVTRLEGSYSGVVGLPLCETVAMLRAAGIPVLGQLVT